MIPFYDTKRLGIPEGSVVKIRKDGVVIWSRHEYKYFHVAFGDSISTGHAIDETWSEKYYGTQYGQNGRSETVIVPNCYVDLLHKEMNERFGDGLVKTTSFGRSGDKVQDMMDKLTHDVVKKTLAKADYVTVCIGANNVLGPVENYLEKYIETGDLSPIANEVAENLRRLKDDSDPISFISLFNMLYEINPNAKYAFTTIYNPYKYLWLDDGENGFFKPLLDTIPEMYVDIDNFIEDQFLGGTDLGIELGFSLGDYIRERLLNADIVRTLYSRVNGLDSWSENFVTALNNVLIEKVNTFNKPNFILADTKKVFDPVPDRPITAPKHYNDLVNVEFTRSYTTSTIHWSPLWYPEYGDDWYSFWFDLAWKHLKFKNAFPSYNPLDYVNFDMVDFVNELMPLVLTRIIVPNVDPHPEEYGHHAMQCCFSEVFGWSTIPRRTITFNANGGTGSMEKQVVVALDGYTAYTNINSLGFSHGTEGYYFTGWNTKADGTGTSYSNGQFIGLSSDITLYAQWTNYYTVTYRHSMNDRTNTHGSGDTGPMDYYQFRIDGSKQNPLHAFSNSAKTYRLQYGTPLSVIAAVERGTAQSIITWNGSKISGESKECAYTFIMKGNVDIHFEWHYWLEASWTNPIQSHWNCHITTY